MIVNLQIKEKNRHLKLKSLSNLCVNCTDKTYKCVVFPDKIETFTIKCKITDLSVKFTL